MTGGDWWALAACEGRDTDLWFPEGGRPDDDQRAALALCRSCPVSRECLTAAMREEGDRSALYRHGIRGGLRPAERAALRQA